MAGSDDANAKVASPPGACARMMIVTVGGVVSGGVNVQVAIVAGARVPGSVAGTDGERVPAGREPAVERRA